MPFWVFDLLNLILGFPREGLVPHWNHEWDWKFILLRYREKIRCDYNRYPRKIIAYEGKFTDRRFLDYNKQPCVVQNMNRNPQGR